MSATQFFEGKEGYWEGINNPYEKGTPEYEDWERGWHSENFIEKVCDDYDGE